MLTGEWTKGWKTIPNYWRFLIVVCLIAGLVFRFVNIDSKVYQYDETFTSLRVSGYFESDAVQYLSETPIVSVEDLQRFQLPSPDNSVVDTVKGLAAEETQLTPLYFAIARFWAEWFGGSIASIRSWSALANLLALPCMWWLCVELFETSLAGWLGTIILAVSPFQVIYAQEARPNGMWVTATLLCSAALLRAMRQQTRASWLVYAITLAVSFYTFLFSGLVAIAHAVYVAILERFRPSPRTIAFVIALCLATLAFSPWLVTMLINLSQVDTVTSWTTEDQPMPLVKVYRLLTYYLALPFIDRDSFELPTLYKALFSVLGWAIRILALYAFYLLCRHTSRRIWLFVLSLTLVPLLALILPDVLLGGSRSTVPRYLVPVFLGVQLAVTYALSRGLLHAIALPVWKQRLWRGITAIVLSVGIASCVLVAQSDTWWNKMISNHNPAMAATINQTDRPLVISDADLGDILSLSYYLDPKVRLVLKPQCYACSLNRKGHDTPYLPEIPDGFSDVFLFHPRPSDAWLKQLEQETTYPLQVLSQGFDNWFWKVKPNADASTT